MAIPRIGQKQVAQAIETLRWTLDGDDTEAAAETRRRARLAAPDCVALLHYVVNTDGFASTMQRVRSANMLLEVAELLGPAAKETGLSRSEPEESDSGREAG